MIGTIHFAGNSVNCTVNTIIWEKLKHTLAPFFSFEEKNKIEKNTYHIIGIVSNETLNPLYSEFMSADLFVMHKGVGPYLIYGIRSKTNPKYVLNCKTNNIIFIDNKTITVYGHDDNSLFIDYHFIIREIISVLFESHGGFLCHASGCSINNEGMLILGPKMAGKTTMLLDLLLTFPDSKFLSNDLVYICIENDQLIAYNWPYFVNIRLGTLFYIDEKYGVTIKNDFKKEFPCYNKDFWKLDKKYTFDTSEFLKIIKKESIKKINVKKIYFPHINKDSSFEKVKIMYIETLLQQINTQIKPFHDPDHTNWLGLSIPNFDSYQTHYERLLAFLLEKIELNIINWSKFDYEQLSII
ncbi:MAG: hypothetical protein A2Y40_06595 [Candidatus Margulisbacteria bacterium GWF2_35_9]|nr:MAG: hypothetical protein A2Y40_06595 [Candidatus Margulisbacteria bacterium GWF2_35_9]